ncbi:MAG: pyridoxamine 5-phosphate oxidase family protein [Flavisolibacter sp.]|jgi:general stress protein 26|nr:pyridoxamine 5-phosphate oxidase family protein [Flavisolibacter sp.]
MEKNLENNEALEKFAKLAREISICMFITNTNEDEHTRPMATIEVEGNGTLWFFTDVRSIKVDEVAKEKEVHLTYAHPGKESYLDVWGTATIVTDRQQIKDRWSPIVKAWFPDGVDDPNLALLKVTPNNCYYWDSETGKMVQFAKMIVAAIAGNPQIADGSEGKLSLA